MIHAASSIFVTFNLRPTADAKTHFKSKSCIILSRCKSIIESSFEYSTNILEIQLPLTVNALCYVVTPIFPLKQQRKEFSVEILQLQDTAMDQASELFKANEDHEILKHLKAAGGSGDQQRVAEMTVKFEEHMQQLEEVCTFIMLQQNW